MAYPAALAFSLLTVQYDDKLIHLLIVQCACHHAYNPPAQSILPKGLIFGLYSVRQLCDIIRPVPGKQFVHVVDEWVEFLGIVGIYYRSQIILETGYSRYLQVDEYGVVVLASHRLIPFACLFGWSVGHVFQTIQYGVSADAVVFCQKVHHQVDDGLFLFLGGDGFGGLVGIDV